MGAMLMSASGIAAVTSPPTAAAAMAADPVVYPGAGAFPHRPPCDRGEPAEESSASTTPEQTQVARFWSDGAGTYTASLWVRAAHQGDVAGNPGQPATDAYRLTVSAMIRVWPLSLAAFQDGQPSAIFVIFICSLWPIGQRSSASPWMMSVGAVSFETAK